MVIFILERVPTGVRGELTRWLIEPRAGVFVGHVSALVRDKLWERVCKGVRGGTALLLYSADTEQGYAARIYGDARKVVRDFDGLSLITTLSA
jgi:CRISPR-associated protein Cas2